MYKHESSEKELENEVVAEKGNNNYIVREWKEWSIISENLILWKITHLVSFCLNKEKNSESAFQNAIKSVICAEVTHDLTLDKASVFVMARYAKYVAA